MKPKACTYSSSTCLFVNKTFLPQDILYWNLSILQKATKKDCYKDVQHFYNMISSLSNWSVVFSIMQISYSHKNNSDTSFDICQKLFLGYCLINTIDSKVICQTITQSFNCRLHDQRRVYYMMLKLVFLSHFIINICYKKYTALWLLDYKMQILTPYLIFLYR